MKNIFVNGLGIISAQNTFDEDTFYSEIIPHTQTVFFAKEPSYKPYIAPLASRRMSKGIKMSVAAAKSALFQASLSQVDAIITGTGMGSVIDSEKFLNAVISNSEAYLTPTSFIQSTHNAVGGQLALELQCKGYNMTYVHGSSSFESALLDAQMALGADDYKNLLLGGVDELGSQTTELYRALHHIKEQHSNEHLLKEKTSGAYFSEGASFFALSTTLQASTYAQVVDVKSYHSLVEPITLAAEKFIEENHLSAKEIDLLILGYNGDVDFDHHYETLRNMMFPQAMHLYYKHRSGEYNTVSAFGFGLGLTIIKQQQIPEGVQLNEIERAPIKKVLLYNQYRGNNHSFILLSQC